MNKLIHATINRLELKNKKEPIINVMENNYNSNLKTMLCNIDNIKQDDLEDIIMTDISYILLNFNDDIYKDILINKKFIYALQNLMKLDIVKLNEEEIYIYNMIIYNYNNSFNANNSIKYSLLSLSKILNKKYFNDLVNIGVPPNLAILITIARFSSNLDSICVNRVNNIIILSTPEIMTIQRIVWIYECLFDHISILFKCIMFDTVDKFNYNHSQLEIIGSISIAILIIIENMPSVLIKEIIVSFINEILDQKSKVYYNVPISTRFSLSSISKKSFPRITNVIEKLKSQNYYIY